MNEGEKNSKNDDFGTSNAITCFLKSHHALAM
jgi:hypothetical protein